MALDEAEQEEEEGVMAFWWEYNGGWMEMVRVTSIEYVCVMAMGWRRKKNKLIKRQKGKKKKRITPKAKEGSGRSSKG